MSSSSSRMELPLPLPCLAFHHDAHSTVLHTVTKEKPHLAVVGWDDGTYACEDVLRNKTVCPTARGLLLVRDPDTMDTFLWSPVDGERVPLPPLRIEASDLIHGHCLLSDEPSAPGCVMLLVEAGDDPVMWYCHPAGDDDEWVKHEYDIGTLTLPYPEGNQYEKIMICPIAACRGKFYFNSTTEDLGVLEFSPAGLVFSSITVDIDDDDDSYEDEDDDGGYEDFRQADKVFLVESDGELYMVTLLYYRPGGGEEIYQGSFVQKMDFAERRWRNVDDLGGCTFLLSSFYFGASCSAAGTGLQQDSVYMVNPRKKEMRIINVKEDSNDLHKLNEVLPSDKAFWLFP